MQNPDQFRKIINLMESIETPVDEHRGSPQTLATYNYRTGISPNTNVNFDTLPDHSNRAFIKRESPRFYFDKENPNPRRRKPYKYAIHPKTGVLIMVADNGAGSMSDLSREYIENFLSKRDINDYRIHQADAMIMIPNGKEAAEKLFLGSTI